MQNDRPAKHHKRDPRATNPMSVAAASGFTSHRWLAGRTMRGCFDVAASDLHTVGRWAPRQA